ncbi:hypothetical protein EI534_25925 [Pseudomonas frederiksbergensis]|nr:hypothetical protein [Pseudomonas frederiksbergensis]
MKLPLPTYQHFTNLYAIAEALHMFTNKIDEAIKSLTADSMQFHGKNHMIQLVMFHSGLPMTEESYKDVETYLGENLGVLLRDYGVAHHGR